MLRHWDLLNTAAGSRTSNFRFIASNLFTMRLSSTFYALLAGLATAAPVEERTTYGTTANEYVNGACKDVILFFARGTGQSGNLVRKTPPDLAVSDLPANSITTG
jgi:hypothetical protein